MTAPDPTPDGAHRVYLFVADTTFDLSHLPVVGGYFDESSTVRVDPLRVILASPDIAATEIDALNLLLPAGTPPLPAAGLEAGLTAAGIFRLGRFTLPFTTAAAASSSPAAASALAIGPPAPASDQLPAASGTGDAGSDSVTWFPVRRGLGPVRVNRVGVAVRSGAQLALLLDSSITLGDLKLALNGLGVTIPLADPEHPTFALDSIGLSYTGESVQISGAFLKHDLEYGGETIPAYGGAARINAGQFCLTAVGSYAQPPGADPSVFVYAALDYPIGGPPFFFVRGVAAGFGCNRYLSIPPIEEIADFPLVARALGNTPSSGQPTSPADCLDELQTLEPYLQISPGDWFLAAGVHFTSFQMVDAFVLLAAQFGERFELDVLGLATITLPCPRLNASGKPVSTATPLAQLRLALSARLVPAEGSLTVRAQLTRDSYVFSRACHLTGGIAFSTWFSGQHSGDFVLTAGGYHPRFRVPEHYPTVPRLGFNWQVSDHLALRGSAYFALTPSAMMAGGALSATWQDGRLKAWFDASADFLISWQPYHYEASLHVSVGASYTFSFFGTHTISVHVGTDVELWGPDFGGTAAIDVSITTIRIRFGASRPAAPNVLTWPEFKRSMLPAADQLCTIALSGNARPGPAGGTDLGVVDPATLTLTTDCLIPSSQAYRGDGLPLPTDDANLSIGVTPARISAGTVSSTHEITITRLTGPDSEESAEEHFTYTPVVKNLPAALWSGRSQPSLSAPATVPDLLTGYEIRPLPPAPAASAYLDLAEVQQQPQHTVGAIQLSVPGAWATRPAGPDEITTTITAATVEAARSEVLAALLDPAGLDLCLTGFTTASFRQTPQVLIND